MFQNMGAALGCTWVGVAGAVGGAPVLTTHKLSTHLERISLQGWGAFRDTRHAQDTQGLAEAADGPSGVSPLLALLQEGGGAELLLLFGWGLAWRPITARVRSDSFLHSWGGSLISY